MRFVIAVVLAGGVMEKPSDVGSEDWGFESLQARTYDKSWIPPGPVATSVAFMLPLFWPHARSQDRARITFAPRLTQDISARCNRGILPTFMKYVRARKTRC